MEGRFYNNSKWQVLTSGRGSQASPNKGGKRWKKHYAIATAI